MKPILAAAALALTASAADAAVYRFEFQKTGETSTIDQPWPIQPGFFEVDLPDLINRSIDFYLDSSDGFEHPVVSVGLDMPGFYPSRFFRFETDENGTLIGLDVALDDGALTNYYGLNSVGYLINFEDNQYAEATGYWTVVDQAPAPVPLPASALLLLTGLAGAGALKMRRRA